jgi:TRAP-type C4-dicarboxylate transport system permease small subunit
VWVTLEQEKRTAMANKILISIEDVLNYIAALCLAIIIIMVIADVAGRLFGFLIPFTNEVSSYMLVPVTYLPAAYGLRHGLHVNVEFALKWFPASVQRKLQMLTDLITLFIVILILLECWGLVLKSYSRGLVSNTMLRAPLYLPQSAIIIGLTFFTIEMFIVTWRSVLLLRVK